MGDKNPVRDYLDMVAEMENLLPGSGISDDRNEIEDLHQRYLNEERVKSLCTSCSKLDFSKILHPTHNDINELASAGPQTAVSQRFQSAETRYVRLTPAVLVKQNVKECRLCSVSWGILRKANNGEEPPVELDGKATIFALRIEPFASVRLPTAEGAITWNVPRLSIALARSYDITRDIIMRDLDIFPDALVRSMFCLQASHIHQTPVRQLVPWSSSIGVLDATFQKSPAYGGRVRPLRVENQLLREWIRLCRDGHGTLCGESGNIAIGPIRLINLEKMCIEKITNPKPETYVALSYTWGKGQNVTLTRSNSAELAQEGALKKLPLPETIMDSIKLTLRLGFEYLWVDALCIPQDETPPKFEISESLDIPHSLLECLKLPQDEDAEKWEQLGKMDKIYGGAFMTLVAAGGNGVHAGLLGTGERSRMHFQDQVFVARKEALNRDVVLMTTLRPQNLANDHFLEGTWWNTRGWCWQERVLSRRCLIFTDEQVYWECKGGSFCEESHYDFGVQPLFRNSREDSLLPDDYEAQQNRQVQINKNLTVLPRSAYESMSSHYWYLILRYSLRHLTEEKDYLHALIGVLNSLTKSWGEEYFWGLPRTTFEQQLLWSGGDNGARMAIHASKDFTGSVWGLPFPSWSWLSKKGHVWMPVSDGVHFYLPQGPGDSKVRCADLYDTHLPEIICYGFDPKALSYDKDSKSWTVKDDAIKPMYDIRSTRPSWLDEVPQPHLLPSIWRPSTDYWFKWGPGGELVEQNSGSSDPELILAIDNWEISTELALFQLDIDKKEGIQFEMGAMDGPQTLVFFWASSAMLKLSWEMAKQSEQFVFDPSDQRKRHGYLMCPAILDNAGQPVGYLNPMHKIFFENHKLEERAFEFVVIASFFDKKDSVRKLDVMVLRRRGLVAKRVTVGHVNEKDWVKAKRAWKMIALG